MSLFVLYFDRSDIRGATLLLSRAFVLRSPFGGLLSGARADIVGAF
jgi:hypothetical protein